MSGESLFEHVVTGYDNDGAPVMAEIYASGIPDEAEARPRLGAIEYDPDKMIIDGFSEFNPVDWAILPILLDENSLFNAEAVPRGMLSDYLEFKTAHGAEIINCNKVLCNKYGIDYQKYIVPINIIDISNLPEVKNVPVDEIWPPNRPREEIREDWNPPKPQNRNSRVSSGGYSYLDGVSAAAGDRL